MDVDQQKPEARQKGIVQMAAFRVGKEEYVIDIMRIKEIINPVKITPVPSSSGKIEGVINLRGVIIPIVDFRKRFSTPEKLRSDQPKYIIVVVSEKIIGVIVDEVLEVVRVPRSSIKPSPELFEGKDPGVFLGVCQHQGRLLLLVDLKRVLSSVLIKGIEVQPDSEEKNPSVT